MEVRVLGPIEVVDGSKSVDVGTRMHRAVLSLLVMDIDRVVSVDRLIDSLWGEDPPATATGALQVYVSGLRKVLEPDRAPRAPSRVLVTEPPGYALRLPAQFVDVARFEALVREGKAMLGAGRPAPAYDLLDISLGLWRGAAYQDLAFESFLQAEIARLGELRAVAAETRAEALLAVGRDAEAVTDLSGMVADDPLRERRWGLLALALYRSGRQGEALRTLSEARRTLGEELGLDLGHDLRRLERDILNQEPELEWRLPVEQPSSGARRVPLRHTGDAILAFASTVAPAAPGWTSEGPVLPPDECPYGYSLTAMGAAMAPFVHSGSDPAHYPDTPFQILYVDDMDLEMVGAGIEATGTNHFTVAAGTLMYVPIWGFTDAAPPVIRGFPSTPSEAPSYFFDPAHLGAEFQLDIDRTSMSIGAEYVTGPVHLRGSERSRMVTLGAFLAPMSPGTHTVTIRGGVSGRGHQEAYGLSYLRETVTYTIEVRSAD